MRVGYVAIVGLPNVGKSTLLNALLETKIAAVAPRPQTTRQRITGIMSGPDHQVLFLDTPGLLRPKYALHEVMRRETMAALQDADLVLWVVEPSLPVPSERDELGAKVLDSESRVVLAINKIDTRPRQELLPVIKYYADAGFTEIVPISALTQEGLQLLKKVLLRLLPEGEPFYPPDQLTTQPERFFAAEFIREAVFRSYGEEIPYCVFVEIDEFREMAGRKDLIRASIYVERESQRAIVIGQGGKALKRVGTQARLAIEAFLGRPVYLELRVKVRERWRSDKAFVRRTVEPS